MSERREKGLCYFCDEPFTTEHNLTHMKLQIHVTEVDDNSDSEREDVVSEELAVSSGSEPLISVNALTGTTSFRIMRVTGYYRRKKKLLHILIDSGSTHNFLDAHVAKKLGCRIEVIPSLNVVVADGNKVQISNVVKSFTWVIQNTSFSSDIMLLPLGCCDLVLGVEWLVTLGDIT